GPQTLNVAPDGSAWLQDSYNSRLLVWRPGQPDSFARTVPLPGFAGGGDFVFGRDGTIYASSPGFLGSDPLLFHLRPSGEVFWSAQLPAALIGHSGRAVRAWRVLSRTQIFPGGGPFFTPELVGGDPVIDLDVARPGQLEHVVLRLGPHSAEARFSLPYSIFGEGTSYADLRIGPDGKLYRLSTSPTNGVTISRYSLQP